MAKVILIFVIVFANLCLFESASPRGKRSLGSCGPFDCPEGTVICSIAEDNKQNVNVIKIIYKCEDTNHQVLAQNEDSRPNSDPDLEYRSTRTSMHFSNYQGRALSASHGEERRGNSTDTNYHYSININNELL